MKLHGYISPTLGNRKARENLQLWNAAMRKHLTLSLIDFVVHASCHMSPFQKRMVPGVEARNLILILDQFLTHLP